MIHKRLDNWPRFLGLKLLHLAVASCCVVFDCDAATLFMPSTNLSLNAELTSLLAALDSRVAKASEADTLAMCNQLAIAWEQKDLHAQAVLAANLSHYVGSRIDFNGAQRPSSRLLAWRALEYSDALTWWQEAQILELLKSAAYSQRLPQPEVSTDDARKELTARWLKLLEQAETAASEAETAAPTSRADKDVSLTASVALPRKRKSITTPEDLVENERLWRESEASYQKGMAELPLKAAALTARQASDGLNDRIARNLTDVHISSGMPERITEVIFLSVHAIRSEKMRKLVLDRLESKLAESVRIPFASARKSLDANQSNQGDTGLNTAPVASQRIPLAVRVRLAASAQARHATSVVVGKPSQVTSHLAAGQVSSAIPPGGMMGLSFALMLLLGIGSGVVILVVLRRAQARAHSGRSR